MTAVRAASIEALRADRDALGFLGLLASLYLRFDPPVATGIDATGKPKPATHFAGLNIHALLVDNIDGELLALERNQIHQLGTPLEHAEQRTLRAGVHRIHAKRPRLAGVTMEDYYRSTMFYAGGNAEPDFLGRGTTLFTSLEPCPMCAATLLVARVKRSVFMLPDPTYGKAWEKLVGYYARYDLRCQALDLSAKASPLAERAAPVHTALLARAADAEKQGLPATHVLDEARGLLARGFEILADADEAVVVDGTGDGLANVRLLRDLRTACNLPGQ